jgi:hypothetical protein
MECPVVLPSGEEDTFGIRCFHPPAKSSGLPATKLNNTRENLKVCPRSENGLNRYQANKDNKTSKIRGVCWDKAKKKWQALICINKKRYWLGYHTDIKDAEKAVQNKLQAMR